MSTLEKMLNASFRGVEFLVPSDELSEGRKTATHEYVNSKRRFIEDLGEMPSKFTVNAIISANANFTVEQNRDRFRAALLEPGVGVLIHPIYGRQEVTVEGDYKVGRDQKESGIYTFSVTFAVSETVIQPQVVVSQPISVEQKDLALRDTLKSNLLAGWIKPEGVVSSDVLANKLIDFSQGSIDAFLPIVGDKSDLLIHLNDSINGAFSIIATGQSISDTVYNSFSFVDDIDTDDPLSIFQALNSLFNFGLDDIPITNIFELSADQIARDFNRDLLNTTISSMAVSQAFTFATRTDFQTDIELRNVRGTLNTSTNNIIKRLRAFVNTFDAATNKGIQTSPVGTADIITQLQNLKANASRVFNDKELNTYRVTSLRTVPTSTRLVSYNLYESEELASTIEALNNSLRPSGIEGDISVLTK